MRMTQEFRHSHRSDRAPHRRHVSGAHGAHGVRFDRSAGESGFSPRARAGRSPARARGGSGLSLRTAVPLAAVVVVVALVVWAISLAASGGCSAQQDGPATDSPEVELTAEQLADAADAQLLASFANPYDWDGLADEGGRMVYYEDGQVASQTGVDVSEHQGWIDWNAVAGNGVDFAYVRVGNRGFTEGVVSVDDYFEYNLGAASEAGLDVGAYFFSQAVNADEAREEAQFVIDQLNGRELALPIAYDHELVAAEGARANAVDRATMTECAKAFCDAVEAAGYSAVIYGNLHDLTRYHLSQLTAYPLWLAEYDVAAPTAPLPIVMWQYTSSGTVAGIDGAVDMNVRFTGAP